MRLIAAAAVVFVVGGATTPAPAESKTPAARLFDEGRALLKDKKFDEACAKFRESFDQERSPGTAINLGDCAERDGKYGRAWELWDEAARAFDRTNRAGAAKVVREKLAALAPKLATIVVRVAEPDAAGLALRIADRPAAPAAEVTKLVDPGKIEVTATAPDKAPFSTVVEGVAGKMSMVDVPSLGGRSLAITGTTGEKGRRSRGRVRFALGLGITGGLVTAGAVVLGGFALSEHEDALAAGCHDDLEGRFVCDTLEARRIAEGAAARADQATYVGLAGAALLAGAIIVYFTAPRETVTVTPIASANSVGLGISGRF